MTWLLWRQHRIHLAIAAAVAGLFAIPVLITGTHLHSAFSACSASGNCGGDLLNGYNNVNTLVDITILVPAVIGLFWGATIVGKELESGTNALVWTQSVPRRQWIRVKLLTLLVMSAGFGGIVSGLVTWWSSTHNATLESRFGGLQFDIQGISPIGYTLFASALGLAAGIFWRRTLPAMATTVGGFVGVRMIVELFARAHYMSPVTKIASFMGPGSAPPMGSLNISSDIMLHGHVLGGAVSPPAACVAARTRGEMDACMQRAGYTFRDVYQPANRYWTFQWIEFGIFAGLTVLLVAAGLIVLRRRDA
jgi:ABC-type transport system involved in multi-copper enzyme maturation permease subunit